MSVVAWLVAHWRLVLLAVLVAWGGWGEWRVHDLKADIAAAALKQAKELADAKDAARENERLLNKTNAKVTDELFTAQKQRAAAARTAAQRLRDLAEARRATAAAEASCRNLDAPAAAKLPDETREHLVELATDAEEVAVRLRACQAYIRDVVRP